MKNEDVDLIQRILSGDESAFTTLVEKHRKWIHSLVWREIGDFHAAQEITQDTFIQAFKSLPSLSDPNRFSGWLHVIAKRQSKDQPWHVFGRHTSQQSMAWRHRLPMDTSTSSFNRCNSPAISPKSLR